MTPWWFPEFCFASTIPDLEKPATGETPTSEGEKQEGLKKFALSRQTTGKGEQNKTEN